MLSFTKAVIASGFSSCFLCSVVQCRVEKRLFRAGIPTRHLHRDRGTVTLLAPCPTPRNRDSIFYLKQTCFSESFLVVCDFTLAMLPQSANTLSCDMNIPVSDVLTLRQMETRQRVSCLLPRQQSLLSLVVVLDNEYVLPQRTSTE